MAYQTARFDLPPHYRNGPWHCHPTRSERHEPCLTGVNRCDLLAGTGSQLNVINVNNAHAPAIDTDGQRRNSAEISGHVGQ